MKRFSSFILFTFICLALVAQVKIKGRIVAEGKGIANVMVTDGYSCVNTNKKGEYEIFKNPNASMVYITTPAGYVTDVESTIPKFFQYITDDKKEYDFYLKKNSKSDFKHTVYVQTDVQVADEAELLKYREIVNDAKDYIAQFSENDIFGLDCGDIVGDHPELYPGYIKEMSALDLPMYRALGNHDMNYYGRTFETSTKRFEGIFGPSYYSFNKGKVHYIVIDNNFYIGREYFYIGYIDERTFSWLEKDLKNISEGTTVVLSMHIPTRLEPTSSPFKYDYSVMGGTTINAESLYAMLKPYNCHIISGHMHTNDNVVFSPNLMEHNTGATSGTWWQLDGCLDGTPCGYSIYEVDGDSIKWHYKGAGHSKDYQLRAYGKNSCKDFPNDIIANVWNYDTEWKVEWLENGKLIGEMEQFTGLDPYIGEKCKDTSKMKYKWISPTPTKHLFRATPKDSTALVEVRVTDRFGNIYSQKLGQ